MMHWKKLGQIFKTEEWDLGENIVGYAQSPQALVFDDFVRIYFCSRRRSSNGKYISTIRFVDFDRKLEKIIRVKNEDVISDADLGTFDEHGIFPLNVVKHNDVIYGYTCGWSRKVGVDIDMAIGLSVSKDSGESFQRLGPGPILSASLNEPFLVGDPFVKLYDGVFHMWYIFGTEWRVYPPDTTPERIYKIAHATSADGIHWNKQDGKTIIPDLIGEDECQALPTIIKISSQYHMFFCYRYASDFRKNSERSYRIGHAVSSDLNTWTRDDTALSIGPSDEGWDSEMLCYPNVFSVDEDIYLPYNGNEFGKHGFGIAKLEGV